ncbi:MAG: hypothetical protein ACP5FZ_01930 [Fidelibacterota bacterium]
MPIIRVLEENEIQTNVHINRYWGSMYNEHTPMLSERQNTNLLVSEMLIVNNFLNSFSQDVSHPLPGKKMNDTFGEK